MVINLLCIVLVLTIHSTAPELILYLILQKAKCIAISYSHIRNMHTGMAYVAAVGTAIPPSQKAVLFLSNTLEPKNSRFCMFVDKMHTKLFVRCV